MAAKSPKREISNFRSRSLISQGVSQLRNTPLAHECHFKITRFCEMRGAKNRATLHLLLSSRTSADAPPPISAGPPWQELEELSPPPIKLHIRASATTAHHLRFRNHQEPSGQRYHTRASSQPPKKKTKAPHAHSPPIEGNLDCRVRPFHSSSALTWPLGLQPTGTPSIRSEPARPEDYRVWTNPSPTDIVRILSRGASTGQYLQRKELPPSMFFIDALLRHNIFPLQHWVQRRGALLEALFRISEGFFFGPHHLIMAALLYFEEKVHQKKLLRADAIPLLFPRLLCQILEHLGYPTEPQFERKRFCREIFTLDKWTNMTYCEPVAPVGVEQRSHSPWRHQLTREHLPQQCPLLILPHHCLPCFSATPQPFFSVSRGLSYPFPVQLYLILCRH
ncbi:hypothetical protein AAG906_031259 [Vitis piasezkii]